MATHTSNVSGVLGQFLQYAPSGQVDMRKTVKVFEDFVKAQLKAHEEIKPTIVKELTEYKRLGEMTLVSFALHALHMTSTGENIEKVKAAIKDLEAQGVIAYQTNGEGTRKGRNAGWTLATADAQ